MDTKIEPVYVDPSGRQHPIPADLIAWRRQWLATDRQHARITEAGVESDEAIEQVTLLRDEKRRLVLQIRAHEWWGTVDNKFLAERAVWAAAGQAERQ